MPVAALYDLTLLIDMLHQTLDQLEDGVFDLAGLLPLVGSLRGWGDPGDRGEMLDGLFSEKDGKVQDAKADSHDDQKDVQSYADPVKLAEETPNHAGIREDVSARQRRHRGLPKPRSPDHELTKSPVPRALCPRRP